jgi:hypothetical protein
MKRPTFILVALLMVSIIGIALAQDKIVLKLKYNLGDELRYHLKTNSNYTIEVEGVPEFQGRKLPGGSMEQEYILNQKVTDISPEQVTTVEFKYESCQMHMFVGDKEISGVEEATKQMVGKTMTMKLDKDGKLLEFSAMEGLPADLAKTDMRQFLKQIQPSIPQKEVKLGEEWIEENKFSLPLEKGVTMDMKIKSKNKFMGIEELKGEKCAKIAIKFYLNFLQSLKAAPDSPEVTLGKGEGQGDFTCYFNVDKGRYESTTGDIKLNFKFFMSMGGNEQNKMMMRMHMLQNMDMKLLPPLPAPEVTPLPTETPSGATTPAPEVAPAPEATPAPQVSPSPTAPATPAPEIKPDAGEQTPSPSVTPTPGAAPTPLPSPKKDESI